MGECMGNLQRRVAACVCVSFLFSIFSFADGPSKIAKVFKEQGFKASLVRQPNGYLKHEYIVPQLVGPYYQLFDWDIYFVGISMAYDGVGTPLASSVLNFLEYVDENSNGEGYVPREIA